MRSTKLISAVAAAAALLVLAPAGVAAAREHPNAGKRRHARPGQGCRVVLEVAPRLLTAGESALAYGQLSCASATSDASQTVTVYEQTLGTPGYTVAGTASTNETGAFELTVSGLQSNSRFYATAGGAQSASKLVRVAAQVTLVGPAENSQIPAALKTGRPNRVTFTGTVSPTDVGATVVLQRQNALTGQEWHPIQLGIVKAGGTFTLTHDFVFPGDANIRVLVRSDQRNTPSVSNMFNYEISQAQNQQLTIATSANPVFYGQSLTIAGTLVGASNTTVTLLSHTARQGAFAPVAEVKTNGSGEYTFSAQSPVEDTFYRVEGAGRKSAVMFQAVEDVLTTQEVSAPTIAAGQSVTFTGTVAPDHTGQPIYLERENASGTSFHVVEVATIGENSTYTISHTVYTAGTDVFRVKVPGDLLNGGAVSPSFTVTVTPPTSASALAPEAPGNSTQPSEGKV